MKCQSLFPRVGRGESKKNIVSFSSADLAHRVVKF